ncbi:glycosyltransferase [Candidatus Pelagibacter bacterium]|nr:glycosyltransferase [Candidatus Pelagibacter bacterium]
MEKKLSIILPVYNEKESLAVMVRLLNSYLKFENEILIIYDDNSDNSLEEAEILEKEFVNVKKIHNTIGKGVMNAIQTGVQEAKYDFILITAVDEIFPIISINEMLDVAIKDNYDFVSGTRYSKGGKRLGGSFIGSILSRLANKLFKFLSNVPLSDCTTGIKLFKKSVWNSIKLESKPIGWAFAFELSIKTYLKGFKITEFPLKSVDRLFGGSSTFKLGSWVKEYLRWFVWGIKNTKNEKK